MIAAKREPSLQRGVLHRTVQAAGTLRGVWAPRRSALAAGVTAALAAGLAAGCGGERQDADEPSGTYKVEVLEASFPARQRLAEKAEMRLTVRNADTRTIPQITVTLSGDDPKRPGGGFAERVDNPELADPTKTIWAFDSTPRNGDTAYLNTWALGPLEPGAALTFRWTVTPVAAGSHAVRWRVDAGLSGNARAQTVDGAEPSGVFRVRVAGKPPKTTVDPETGAVRRE